MTGGGGKIVHVRVDHDLCAGVGMCVQFAPAGFRFDAAGQSEFIPDGGWSVKALQEAADACPMSAITLTFAPADTP